MAGYGSDSDCGVEQDADAATDAPAAACGAAAEKTLDLHRSNTVLTPVSMLVLDRANSGFGASVGPITYV